MKIFVSKFYFPTVISIRSILLRERRKNWSQIRIQIRTNGLTASDADPGDPKTYGSGYGSGKLPCRYINISLQRQHVIQKLQNNKYHGLSKLFAC
jgi:hypothetical protein